MGLHYQDIGEDESNLKPIFRLRQGGRSGTHPQERPGAPTSVGPNTDQDCGIKDFCRAAPIEVDQ
jgi:hypothetical protein